MRRLLPGVLAAALTYGCGDRAPVAYGDPNSIIVLAQDELWRQVEDSVQQALEPRVFTVRNERMFLLTHVGPTEPRWGTLRQFRQLLVIGRPDDPWIEEVARRSDEPVGEAPAILTARDVWANQQLVTAAVVPSGQEILGVYELLPRLHDLFDQRFRRYTMQRMFASGMDTALTDTLRRAAGFSLLLPNVYRRDEQDSTYLFRNDPATTGADDLVRSVLVTWRTGAPRALAPEDVLAWREQVAQRYYQRAMVTRRDPVRVDTVTTPGGPMLEVQGVWESPPGSWPGAGPFVTRIAYCPEQQRTYILDAWLYAPGKDKYEYMLQLWTILDSFRCSGA